MPVLIHVDCRPTHSPRVLIRWGTAWNTFHSSISAIPVDNVWRVVLWNITLSLASYSKVLFTCFVLVVLFGSLLRQLLFFRCCRCLWDSGPCDGQHEKKDDDPEQRHVVNWTDCVCLFSQWGLRVGLSCDKIVCFPPSYRIHLLTVTQLRIRRHQAKKNTGWLLWELM